MIVPEVSRANGHAVAQRVLAIEAEQRVAAVTNEVVLTVRPSTAAEPAAQPMPEADRTGGIRSGGMRAPVFVIPDACDSDSLMIIYPPLRLGLLT